MTRHARWAASVVIVPALIACATAKGTVPQAGRGNDRVLSRDQLLAASAVNLYEAIAKLRPQCLQARTSSNIRRNAPDSLATSNADANYGSAARAISLYVDGVRIGTVDDLRSMPMSDVLEVECLTATDAAQRFGLNNVSGAVAVRTGKR